MNEQMPQGWVVCPLGEVMDIQGGSQPPKSEFIYEPREGYIQLLQIRDFGEKPVPTYVKKNRVSKFCHKDDVLIARYGASLGRILTGLEGAYNVALAKTIFDEKIFCSRYIFYLLQTSVLQTPLKMISRSAQNGFAKHEIAHAELPIPPLAEQHRIVAKIEELFSELDKGIESLKTAQEQLKVYRQSLLKHAFEGKLTAQWRAENSDKLESADALLKRIQQEREQRYQQQLVDWEADGKQGSKPKALKALAPLTAEELAELPGLPASWVGARLGWMTCSVEYGTAAKSSESGVCPVLRMGNIQNGVFDWSDLVYTDDKNEISKYMLHKGDVLFNRTNSPELVGKAAIFQSTGQAVFAGYLIRVNQIPTIVDEKYLNYFLNSHIAKSHGNKVKTDGVNQSNINGEKLVNYPFPFCMLAEQKKIVEILEARITEIDNLQQTIVMGVQQSEALRQSILKKAFSGQLVPQDPNDEPASALLARIKAEKAAQPTSKKART